MKILVMNGPNLNFLGIREPGIYGTKNYIDLINELTCYAKELGIELSFYQSNHEGSLIDEIQKAYLEHIDGIVINPGAYTHYSYALHDALKSVSLPAVEVHMSNINEREEFRKVSVIRPACIATFMGKQFESYKEAIYYLFQQLS